MPLMNTPLRPPSKASFSRATSLLPKTPRAPRLHIGVRFPRKISFSSLDSIRNRKRQSDPYDIDNIISNYETYSPVTPMKAKEIPIPTWRLIELDGELAHTRGRSKVDADAEMEEQDYAELHRKYEKLEQSSRLATVLKPRRASQASSDALRGPSTSASASFA